MGKITLLFISAFAIQLSVAQAQTQNSISPTDKKSLARKDSAGVYTFVEHMPEFPGGDDELMKFIKNKLRYPKMELDNHIEGKVIVRFVIDEEGSVQNPIVTQKVSLGLDKEALRIVRSLPKFIPGKQQGKPVKTYYNVPITFKL